MEALTHQGTFGHSKVVTPTVSLHLLPPSFFFLRKWLNQTLFLFGRYMTLVFSFSIHPLVYFTINTLTPLPAILQTIQIVIPKGYVSHRAPKWKCIPLQVSPKLTGWLDYKKTLTQVHKCLLVLKDLSSRHLRTDIILLLLHNMDKGCPADAELIIW